MTKSSSIAALLLGALLCGTSAFAQTASQMDRAQRLEAQVAALGGSVGGNVEVAQLSPSVAADFEIRLQNLERSLSELTGKYEESTYQLSQMRDRLEKVNADIDFRLKDLETKGGGALGDGALGPAKAPAKSVDRSADRTPEKTPEKPTQTAAVPPLPANASPDKQFERAFELLRQADYEKADKALLEFIDKNKAHPLAANAQFWLGESAYARRKFPDAVQAYRDSLVKYPKSPKASESLLKMGMALQEMNKKPEACTAFSQLSIKFPDASASVKRRADTERKRLNCPT